MEPKNLEDEFEIVRDGVYTPHLIPSAILSWEGGGGGGGKVLKPPPTFLVSLSLSRKLFLICVPDVLVFFNSELLVSLQLRKTLHRRSIFPMEIEIVK